MSTLTERLKSNDQKVLKELFDAHYRQVCGTIHRLVGERGVTEDLAQQVFIRFWEKRETIVINTSAGAYLHRMAVNEALGWLRSRKNQSMEEVNNHTPLEPVDDVHQELEQEELQGKITRAIEELPPRCRAVFQLSRFEEKSYQEIAEDLDISIKTVEHQVGKALRVLRERLKGYLDGRNLM